jgi:hypothetical protein
LLILFHHALSNAAARDSEKGVGWERFEFDKDAPLDDEEIEGLICLIICFLKQICLIILLL